MAEPGEEGNSIERRSAPPATLSRRQLTLTMICVTLLPIGLALLLWFTMPGSEEPTLGAEVRVGPAAWPADGSAAARTEPCVELSNPSGETWDNVCLSINSQYFYYHRERVTPDGQILVPLKHFHTKGHQAFSPDKHAIKLITVYAQIPSGARAILEVDPSGAQKEVAGAGGL